MNVEEIYYSKDFVEQYKKLPKKIQTVAIRKERLFRNNGLHPSLRLHGLKGNLKGLYSISLTMNFRIIFQREKNSAIIFISVGTHDLYKNL